MIKPWHRLSDYWKRIVVISSISFAVLFALDLGSVISFSFMHPAIPHKVDAVIVLGAKVGTPALKYRTLTGLMYYREGKTDTLVLSGAQGRGESTTEAQAMESVVQEQVKRDHEKMPHLILEARSMNTFQNLSNSRAVVPHARSVIVISDCYHLERSVVIAKHVGFERVYWNSPRPSYYSDVDLAHYYVREAVAMVAYLPRLI